MGHLVHPLAFRLGSYSNWYDSWFIRRVSYAEFFHVILKMRAFLTFYAESSLLERSGFFFSHFSIIFLIKFFFIHFFFYNGDLEDLVSTFVSSVCFFRWRRLKIFPKSRFFLRFPLKIFIILFSFLHLVDIQWDLSFFVAFLLRLRNFTLLKFLKNDLVSIDANLKYFFLFFLHILQRVFFSKGIFTKYQSFSLLIKRLIFSYVSATGLVDFFSRFKIFLEECLNVLFGLRISFARFSLLTFETITASFLARYFAMRLSRGFTIKSLVRPIMRDWQNYYYIVVFFQNMCLRIFPIL